MVADIPGIIEGAHEGHGLGIQFLRHIERTRLLAHLVDVSEESGRDPVEDFEIIMKELASYSETLAAKPMIVVATKMDVAQDRTRVDALRELAKERGLRIFRDLERHRPGHRRTRSSPWVNAFSLPSSPQSSFRPADCAPPPYTFPAAR